MITYGELMRFSLDLHAQKKICKHCGRVRVQLPEGAGTWKPVFPRDTVMLWLVQLGNY